MAYLKSSPRQYASNYNDCFNFVDWDCRNNGTASGFGQDSTDDNRPGVFYMDTGTDTGGKCSIIYSSTGSNSPNIKLGSALNLFYESPVKMGTLATITDDYIYYAGPADGWVFGNPGNGVYFEYNRSVSDNWLAFSANSASFTSVDTGVPVTTDWVDLMIKGNNSEMNYYLDGVLVATISTNLPSAPVNLNMALITKTAGTTAVRVYQDYFDINQAVVR